MDNLTALYKERRTRLLSMLANHTPGDTIILCAAADTDHALFVQDSNFYYYTGLEEPGAVLCIEGDGTEILFVPSYGGLRAQWSGAEITEGDDPAHYGVSEIRYQGKASGSYTLKPFGAVGALEFLVEYLIKRAQAGGHFNVVASPIWHGSYSEQLLWYLGHYVPQFNEKLIDISAVTAIMRRRKDEGELAALRQAIDRTHQALVEARSVIKPGAGEYEVRAAIEASFVRLQSPVPAFPSIVASGANAVRLHYREAASVMRAGDLVVLDVGATAGHYSADISRTYPVSGVFTKRQRELYQIVLDAQEYVASVAKPGMYLTNRQEPSLSLNHLVKGYFERYSLGGLMPHSVGHYLGLDTHDVGDRAAPLEEGDVITIEPGIYISGERLGIRIEDDYVVTQNGVDCLSSEIPKKVAEIESV